MALVVVVVVSVFEWKSYNSRYVRKHFRCTETVILQSKNQGSKVMWKENQKIINQIGQNGKLRSYNINTYEHVSLKGFRPTKIDCIVLLCEERKSEVFCLYVTGSVACAYCDVRLLVVCHVASVLRCLKYLWAVWDSSSSGGFPDHRVHNHTEIHHHIHGHIHNT